jgi:hypothetical protein
VICPSGATRYEQAVAVSKWDTAAVEFLVEIEKG